MKNVPDPTLMEKKRLLIDHIIEQFYGIITTDFLLGYHFRKIQEFELGPDGHPLLPPLEAFSSHLPKIQEFWYRQLLGQTFNRDFQFDLINTHQYLKLKRGEIDRFHLLFKEVLQQNKENLLELKLLDLWEEKLEHFVQKFKTIYSFAPTQA